MKIESKKLEPKGFKPFELTITVENKEEALMLLAHFNVNSNVLADEGSYGDPKGNWDRSEMIKGLKSNGHIKSDLWKFLTDTVINSNK